MLMNIIHTACRCCTFFLQLCTVLSLLLLFWITDACAEDKSGSLTKTIDFAHDIRPILTDKCLGCHGGDEPDGGLQLSEREALYGIGDSGHPIVVPGEPAESELLRRILSDDANLRMPPEDGDTKQLTADEIEKLKRWVTEGATWSAHWAFQPLAKVELPQVANESWIRNEIDRFVLAKLESSSLTAASEADRYTLIKRLYYDLVGLPAPVEEVDAFVNDESSAAYDLLVDRLLDSPHFGERWGRHWLDLAHFADSDGYEKDRARPDAYVYRDWVIDAINQDMPFDQFTVEQLAGDLLPGASSAQRIATGFLRQTLTNEEGGVDQEEFRVNACFDRTETVGTVWLGLTIGCVRCHQHKYDPIPLAEYYKLFAFFNSAEELKSGLPVAADNIEELQRKLRPLEQALAARYSDLAPAAIAWETAEHQRTLAQPEGTSKEHAIKIESVSAESLPSTAFHLRGGEVFVGRNESTPVPDKEVYTITARAGIADVTGFKLHVLPDERLPSKGVGLAPNGNFVLTGFQAFVVSREGHAEPIELHRAKADFSQSGFTPEKVLHPTLDGRQGWAVADKTSANHWIQFRTLKPLKLNDELTLKVVLQQQYGGQHLLGKFRLDVLTGGERGLHLPDEAIASALEMYPEKRVANLQQQLFDFYVSEVACDEQVSKLRQQINELQHDYHAQLVEVRTIGQPRMSRVTRVLSRGDFLSPAEAVDPGVPAILTKFQPRSATGDRLDLARWLVSEANFLTPRVAVNNVWQRLFGHGLVRTPNDFGTRGEPPTHPELLDWLAARFQRELKWSRKELIRLIVTSSTYRQSSNFRSEIEPHDSANTLLFRQNRFRVESEIVRDLHLSVAGLLSPKVGGPSVFPPMPEELAKLSYADSFSWKNSVGEDRYRRGLYTFFKRTIPHPNLMTFDSPDANIACCVRTVSNTPLQALTLLNNEVHIEAAEAFAHRVLDYRSGLASGLGSEQAPIDDQSADVACLSYAMRLCVARPPTPAEISSLARVLETSRTYYTQHEDAAIKLVKGPANKKFGAAEAAAWVATVRIVLNLDEFLTRE